MKILMAHNRYRIRGGEDESFDAESRLLEEKGHSVIRYIRDNRKINKHSILQTALRVFWSAKDYDDVRSIIERNRPDILHVQNHFPLISPAIYYAAKAEGIPVIQTLRNYRLFCLNSYFFRSGRVCESCSRQPFPISGIRHKCYRDNLPGSIVVSGSLTFHRILRTYLKAVDLFIVLTEFAKLKYSENGIPSSKIVLKPNFVDPDPGMGKGKGNFVLFVGRLSPEKGISTMLEAWQQLGHFMQLKVVGDGPLSTTLQDIAKQYAFVDYLGRQPIHIVQELMGQARALIFPSLWFEGMPRVVIEAFATGTPVIASKLGATATMVEHQKTGLHFSAGNSQELIQQVLWMLDNQNRWEKMRTFARQQFENYYTAGSNYQQLIDIYQQALQKVHSYQ